MNSYTIEEEMQRRPLLNKQDIRALKEWCEKHNYLMSDSDLALFLHSNNYSMDNAEQNIRNFWTIRTLLPEYFTDRNPIHSEGLKQAFETLSIISLPQLTEEGYKVILVKLNNTIPSNYIFNDAVKFLNMVIDVCTYEEGSSNGFIIVIDINGATLNHTRCLTLGGLKKFFQCIDRGSVINLIGLHYINTSPVKNMLHEFVQSNIINRKFIDRLYLHSDLDSFKEIVPLEIFPDELGGSAGSFIELRNSQIEKLKNYADWFNEKESHYKLDSIRVMKEKLTITDVFRIGDEDFTHFEID